MAALRVIVFVVVGADFVYDGCWLGISTEFRKQLGEAHGYRSNLVEAQADF